MILSTSVFSQDIERDATFGLTARFFKKRAVFKKTSSNKAGTFAFPKAESDALDLSHKQPVNMAVIKLDTNEVATVRNLLVSQDADGFFNFNLDDSIGDQLGGEDLENLAPIPFVVSPVGLDYPNPANDISPLENRIRGRYTASRFLVYKSYVAEDDRGSYVTIEPNERDYHGVEPGDTLSVTTIPIGNVSARDALTRFFNKNISADVVDASPSRGVSRRVYLDNLLDRLDYKPGTLVQVIAIKV
jgi:hypothetical protein